MRILNLLSRIETCYGDTGSAGMHAHAAAGLSAKTVQDLPAGQIMAPTKRYEEQSRQQSLDELNRRNEQQAAELQKDALQQRWYLTLLAGGLAVFAVTAVALVRLRRSHRLLREAHVQLRQSRNNLQAMLNAIPDLMFEMGPDGRYHDCHSLNLDMLLAAPEALIGKTVVEVMPLDAARTCLLALQEAHEKGLSTGRQFALPLAQGKRWFELSVARKTVGLGEAPRFIVLSRDITERKRNELLERAQLEMLERLAENALLAEALVPVTACVEELHPDFCCSIMVVDADGSCLRSIPTPSMPQDYTMAMDGIVIGVGAGSCGTAAALGTTVIVEDVREHPYWTLYKHLALQAGFLACWAKPVFDSSGKVLGTLGIHRRSPGMPSQHELVLVRKICYLAAVAIERYRFSNALERSEQEFRTLAENSPGMIVRYDREHRRVYLNPAYERYTGIPLAEAWGRTPHDIWKPLMSREEYMTRLDRVMETGVPNQIHLEWLTSDGSLTSHLMHAVAEYDAQGVARGALVIGHDISELKTVQRRLEQSRAELRALAAKREAAREEERKRIAREIHDELGQLLNVLRLNVTTLDYRFGEKNPGMREQALRMVSTVDRAITVVRSLVTHLRPPVLNAGLWPALEWAMQEFAGSTGIACALECDAEEIHLDESKAVVVFRIVQESLTNVLRHADADRVDISLSQRDGICEVEVRDNGKGFDPANVRRRDSYGIAGMQERALMLDGVLDIASSPGRGTVLRLRVPVAECAKNL